MHGWRGALGSILVVSLVAGCSGGSAPAPTPRPTVTASAEPSPEVFPSTSPTTAPTVAPSAEPTVAPTANPAPPPTLTPTATPTAAPAPALPGSLRGAEWTRLPTTRKIVALTFDAGSNADGLPKILATLDRYGVPGTFFLTGRWIELYPKEARAIAANQAHSIGNHSYDHPYMTQLTDAQMLSEIARAQDLIVNGTDRDPRPLFRFPYGDVNAHAIVVANSAGYGGIRWTVDTLGWEGASAGQTAASVTKRSLDAATPGEIVIMHIGSAPDGSTLDADALAAVIEGLQAKGYGFVAVWDFIYGLA